MAQCSHLMMLYLRLMQPGMVTLAGCGCNGLLMVISDEIAVSNERGEAQLWSVWFNGHVPNLINSSFSRNTVVWACEYLSWCCLLCNVMLNSLLANTKINIKGSAGFQYKLYWSHTVCAPHKIILIQIISYLQWCTYSPSQ